MAANANRSEEVKAFVCRYVKNGNYFAINESTLAAKLMDEFKSKFLTTKGD